MKSILLVKKFLGVVEMTSGLINASFSLPEWRAVKMIFFAPRPCLHPEILHTIVFGFSWDDCNTQEKLEKMVMQNFGGKQCVLWSQ